MRLRDLVPVLVLFAVLAPPARAGGELVGVTGVTLDPSSLSLLGVDLAELELAACGANGPGRGTVLVIVHDGGGGATATVELAVLDMAASQPRGTFALWVQPLSLAMIGPQPLELSCGSFLYHLELDRMMEQPVSVLRLVPATSSGTGGSVSGPLALAAVLILEPLAGGPAIALPRPLTLQVAGSYVQLAGRLTRPGESTLQLLARDESGYVAMAPACLAASEPYTTFCLGVDPAKVGLPVE